MAPHDRQLLRTLAAELNLSINKTVALAVRDLAERMGREPVAALDEVDQARVKVEQLTRTI